MMAEHGIECSGSRDLATLQGNAAPLSVVHVVLSLDCGGLERIVLSLIREGRRLGQEPSIICLERPGVLAGEAKNLGARVISLGKTPGLTPRLVARIRESLRELRPAVVHTHQIGALLYAGPAARAEGVPVIVHTEHINNVAKAQSRGRRMRTRLLWCFAARYADRFFCVAEDIAAAARHLVPRHKLHIVQNGIDISVFDGENARELVRAKLHIPPGAKVIGTVGRLNEVKSQDILIRAFGELRRALPDIHLLLVGDGPSRQSLERLTADLGIGSYVHFAGYQAEPHKFLRAMDVFALPSRLEGTPLAILEAWAARLPVIASRVGGVPRLVSEGKTALLFDFPNCRLLTEGLERILTDAELATSLRNQARHEVETRFDSRIMAKQYDARYREALTQS